MDVALEQSQEMATYFYSPAVNKQTNHIHKYIKLLTPASSTPTSEKYLACSHCSILHAVHFQTESNLKREKILYLVFIIQGSMASFREGWALGRRVAETTHHFIKDSEIHQRSISHKHTAAGSLQAYSTKIHKSHR